MNFLYAPDINKFIVKLIIVIKQSIVKIFDFQDLNLGGYSIVSTAFITNNEDHPQLFLYNVIQNT